MITRRNANKFLIGAGAVAGITALVVLVQHPAQAQVPARDASDAQAERQRPAVKIGTYDPQAAFQGHPAQNELMEALREAQFQMQQAQQEEDQQKVQQIQQQYEQARQEAIQQFEEDVAEVMPAVARAAGVKVVATEVVYKADDVKAVDITPRVAKSFKDDGADGAEEREAPALPQFPQ